MGLRSMLRALELVNIRAERFPLASGSRSNVLTHFNMQDPMFCGSHFQSVC